MSYTNRRLNTTFDVYIMYLIWLVIVAGMLGWVLNIITLFSMESVTGSEGIVRIISVFIAPLGSLMGYL